MTQSKHMNRYNTSVLLIYTGGTIGMMENPETGALENFNLEQLQKHIPELQRFDFHIDTYQFDPPIDSSDMDPDVWRKLVHIISKHYDEYTGFVILHGTDTMAYTASALSFMLEGLNKPVILTGSQLPIGVLRTDGKENLLTSIEIAISRHPDGCPMVPEVCIFFENHLMRGNRTTKINAEDFNAFRSFNYPVLASAGIHIKYNNVQIHRYPDCEVLRPHDKLNTNIAVLKLFPGIQKNVVNSLLTISGLKAVVLETYGSGNATRKGWFLQSLHEATMRGIIIVNVTQCNAGTVEMERYETGYRLMQAGVICGYDSTTESAVTKLMFLLGQNYSPEKVRQLMQESIAGEITLP
ncbi:L-asparaginase, type I [gut metagenome]|uniref:asparaginase n=1 Tax=gut metagenome TaxID=749906 RepID=J9FSP2_9ZZZZ